jgi:tight adherence protein C
MPTTDYIVPTICFGAVAAATYAMLIFFDPYWLRVRSRMGRLQTAHDARRSDETAQRVWRLLPSQLLGSLPHTGRGYAAQRTALEQRLARAGIYQPSAVAKYFVARLALTVLFAGATVGVGALGLLQMNFAMLLACVAGGAGAMAPSVWLDRAIARYHLLLQRSLPDFLDLMTVCLEGGLSLQETIRRVSEELKIAHPALASELSVVQRDVELGATVDQALKRFATRCNYEGVRTMSTFIREAQRFGTNITEALRSHADLLRSQREQAAEENAQKAAVKILIPTLLLIFPAIFVVAVGPAVIQIQEAFAAE